MTLEKTVKGYGSCRRLGAARTSSPSIVGSTMFGVALHSGTFVCSVLELILGNIKTFSPIFVLITVSSLLCVIVWVERSSL